MSGETMKWARKQTVRSAPLKAVVNVIAARAGPNGSTFASQATLAGDAGMGERTIRRHLAVLEELGVITRQVRSKGRLGRLSDLLTLTIHRSFDLSAQDVSKAKKAIEARSNRPSSNRPVSTVTTGQRWPGNNRGITPSYQEGEPAYQGRGYTRVARLAGAPRLRVVNGGFVDGGEAGF